jgi:hypothetical protein
MWALVLAAVIVYLFGLLDDARGLSAIPKLTGQVLASAVLILSNVSVHFIESISLPFLSAAVVTLLDVALTIFWLVGVTNDEYDWQHGWKGRNKRHAFLFVLVTSLSGQVYLTEISILLLGITVEFIFQWTPARGLGDSGSQTFGLLRNCHGICPGWIIANLFLVCTNSACRDAHF